MRTRKHWRLGITISKLVKNTLYSHVNVFSARFTWSSEPPEGLAVCRAKVILRLCSSVILRPWVWYGPRKLFKHSYELMPRSKNNRKSNSAVSRNRFTGHPRCGEFDNWVSNNWLLSSARKTLAHCHRIWNRKMLIWWFYAMLIFQLTSVHVQENLLFWTKRLLNIEMFSPFFRRFVFFVVSSKILEALYAQG